MLDFIDWEPLESIDFPTSPGVPYATHKGTLRFGGMNLRVYRLSTGERVIEETDLARFFGEDR